ncbi:MAG: hypothetical protein QF570_08815 [Myxococcota bacterium]|jgi:uncharacterized protein YhhL (DUF1145 family)|nr:hypothetical protein [Myxococcota bacterium]
MKQSVLVMWLVLLLIITFGGGTIQTGARWLFWLLAIVHVAEFFWKKSVLEKAGGSMGHHFVQVLIYGLFHWKPLEEQQQQQESS